MTGTDRLNIRLYSGTLRFTDWLKVVQSKFFIGSIIVQSLQFIIKRIELVVVPGSHGK